MILIQQSFDNFFKDMGYKPSKFHSIERKDPNGNYEPSNCVWATKKEQNNIIKRNGIVLTMGVLVLDILCR